MSNEQDLAQLLGETPASARQRRWSLALRAGLPLLVVAGLLVWWLAPSGTDAPAFQTEAVSRGDITLTVTADGTLEPTRAVEVGSELSGTVTRVFVDVNDTVAKDQELVELDTAKLNDQIVSARATLASARAQVAQAAASVLEARSNLTRLEEVAKLSNGKVPSAAELDTARATLQRALADESSARASVEGAEAVLSTNQTNLAKASIRSPIDGVVLSRNVDPGNAVAASLQAVTLFTIAEDLTKLRLRVNVDEADVGSLAASQTATFTVSAYPSRQFPATITRIAFGSTSTNNVVTYLTDLDVDNSELSLRPGMTATATIVAAQRRNVLRVPNAALRFDPQQSVGSTAAPGAGGGIVGSLMPRPPGMGARNSGNGGGAEQPEPSGGNRVVWVLREGVPVAVNVVSGISDGRSTEIVGGDLAEGMDVITARRSGTAR
jgi:HlyD family secretion protein